MNARVYRTGGFSILIALASTFAPDVAIAVDIEPVTEGVWSATQPEQRKFNDCNSLIVEASDFLIVVDAQESASDVQQIIDFASSNTGKPVRYLVNTHWHGDHTRGNTLYRETYGENLTIIGHTSHKTDIFERAAKDLADRVARTRELLPAALEQLRTGIKRDGSRFTEQELIAQRQRVADAQAWVVTNENAVFEGPSLTVDRNERFEAGRASFVVIPMRGHTRGDLVIHFPQLGVVATGDLVDAIPYAGHGFPAEWSSALGQVRALEAHYYLPGHGSLLTDTRLIETLSAYFASLVEQVVDMHARGLSAGDIEGAIDLSASRAALAGDDERAGRFFDQVQGEAIARAIDEIE